jgi:hypothetical protein
VSTIPRTRDHRDDVIEMFADEAAALRTELDAAKQDRDAYRLIAVEAVAALSHVITERDRLKAKRNALLDENRALRCNQMQVRSDSHLPAAKPQYSFTADSKPVRRDRVRAHRLVANQASTTTNLPAGGA